MSFFRKVLPFGAGSLFRKSPFMGQAQTLFRKAPMVLGRGLSFANDAFNSPAGVGLGLVARGLGGEGRFNQAKRGLNTASNILERAKPVLDTAARYI